MQATSSIPFNEDRLNNDDSAEYIGAEPHTLEVWRSTGRYDIPYVKVGSRVFYRKSDLDAFLERRTVRKAG